MTKAVGEISKEVFECWVNRTNKVAKYEERIIIGETDPFYDNWVVRAFPNDINPLKIKGN